MAASSESLRKRLQDELAFYTEFIKSPEAKTHAPLYALANKQILTLQNILEGKPEGRTL